jgi:Zn-dependent peptidase ImmA (M78 family)/transcriptional regulator with XRE-family HTH domain
MKTGEDRRFNPEMLVIARKARGLSQADLAERLSMTQSHLSKIEAELLNPPAEMIPKLAQVLMYREDFFLRQDMVCGIEGATIFHRRRQSVGTKLLARVEAQVNIYRMHIARLLRSVDITDSKFQSYDIEEYGNIENIANAVRASWMLSSGPINHLVRAVENAGGIVIPYDFGTMRIDGLSQWIHDLPPMFFINSRLSGDRFRLSLAHELGHMLLHRIPTPDMEKEAFAFAGCFLMPTRDITPSLNDLSLGKLADLKAYWKVSMAAIIYRAETLKLIDADRIRRLRIMLAPYRTREPVDIPVEEPTILSEIIEMHLRELGYTSEELSKLLSIYEPEFSRLHNTKQRRLVLA